METKFFLGALLRFATALFSEAIAPVEVISRRRFQLHIGQDVSIGYLSHNDAAVRLNLQETFTFLLLTSEAAVALTSSAKA